MFTIDTHETLARPAREAVRTLAARVAAHDGINPLNDEAELALNESADKWDGSSPRTNGTVPVRGQTEPFHPAQPPRHHHLLSRDGSTLVGYAFLAGSAAQIAVDPDRRRQGIGTELLHRLTQLDPATSLWSFGDLECARAFTRAAGYEPVRAILTMEADLERFCLSADWNRPNRPRTGTVPIVRGLEPSQSSANVRSFTPADLDDLVRLNARAFADHPEQGRLTRADFETRMAAAWFDPEGLLIARNEQGDMTGFHWTKIHPEGYGEVYVLAVDPSASRHGLGRTLLNAGLIHLARRGLTTVRLWVEADNQRARTLYERSDFAVVSADLSYRKLESGESRVALGVFRDSEEER